MGNIGTGADVVSFLKTQHEQIKTLFSEVLAATGGDREHAFVRLRRLMAIHETAEEEIVHPVAKREMAGGERIIAMRLKEEHEAKKMLTELEDLGNGTSEFQAKLQALHSAVLAHAEAEERDEFAVLEKKLEPAQLRRMGRAAELAEAIAPTRPHSGLESHLGNVLVGPFASMIDRVRDFVNAPTAREFRPADLSRNA